MKLGQNASAASVSVSVFPFDATLYLIYYISEGNVILSTPLNYLSLYELILTAQVLYFINIALEDLTQLII